MKNTKMSLPTRRWLLAAITAGIGPVVVRQDGRGTAVVSTWGVQLS